MKYTEDFFKKIKSFGALSYTVEKIISILNPENPDELRSDFKNPKSLLAITYKQGLDIGRYNIRKELFDTAKTGDIDAIKMIRELKAEEELDELINDRFNV